MTHFPEFFAHWPGRADFSGSLQAIASLSWQEFESNFLARVLEGLGFNLVEITQPTRDGGKDAYCRYKRGIVTSEAIVSAKHWKAKKVGAEEVQRMRGIRGNAATAVIVTSSEFSNEAKAEAEPGQTKDLWYWLMAT